jgi:spore maturation protein CgeB
MFYHSLRSDWNHGNAHFLRGVVTELKDRGHTVDVYEPADAWSVQNLVAEYGAEALDGYQGAYPGLDSTTYDLQTLDLDHVLRDADMVLVHEWNDHDLVARIGEHRATRGGYRLFFHDTHHRAVTDSSSMASYDLRYYDGVLAFGNVIREIYRRNGWARNVWTWHEAADTQVFHPIGPLRPQSSGNQADSTEQTPSYDGDLVWIGNWGDDERTAELYKFLLTPVRRLGLQAKVYGVRYPKEALEALADAGIEYGGWLPNYRAPEVFARYKFTVHVPRRPYTTALPGIPTIRVFEALACGIPLISAPWDDAEGLFTPGEDFLMARDTSEMVDRMSRLLADHELRYRLADHGLATIQARHTCAHRVDQLLEIYEQLAARTVSPEPESDAMAFA